MPSAPRRTRWITPVALLVVWLVLGGLLGPYAGKLGEVASNDQAPSCRRAPSRPRSSTSRRRFQQDDTLPAVVVWTSDGGRVGRRAAEGGHAARWPRSPASPASPARPRPRSLSKDGQALQGVVQIRPNLGEELPGASWTGPRRHRRVEGTKRRSADPAASQADLSDAFAGIDGLLLGRGARRRAADPAAGLPQRPAAAGDHPRRGLRAGPGLRGGVRAGRGRRRQRRRPGAGHPLDPRHRRGDRLRPAALLPLPRGTGRARRPLRGHTGGAARLLRGDHGQRRDGGARAARPAPERPDEQPRARAGRRDRHRVRRHQHLHLPARGARCCWAAPRSGRARPATQHGVEPRAPRRGRHRAAVGRIAARVDRTPRADLGGHPRRARRLRRLRPAAEVRRASRSARSSSTTCPPSPRSARSASTSPAAPATRPSSSPTPTGSARYPRPRSARRASARRSR